MTQQAKSTTFQYLQMFFQLAIATLLGIGVNSFDKFGDKIDKLQISDAEQSTSIIYIKESIQELKLQKAATPQARSIPFVDIIKYYAPFNTEYFFGIDVSKNNGLINWDKAATNNPQIDFVFIKATEGIGYKDPMCDRNAKEAARVGFKFGYYHFATLNKLNYVDDAKSEARAFAQAVKKLPSPTLPYILDLEKITVKLTKPQVLTWVKTFYAEMEVLGHTNIALYSGKYFLNANLPTNHDIGHLRYWHAEYPRVFNYTALPHLPIGFTKCWIWQYTCKGRINGIKGDVDLNISTNKL